MGFFKILNVLYHGISNGHTEYKFQILSYAGDIALTNLLYVNKHQNCIVLVLYFNPWVEASAGGL
jgi:hypothetical protein